MSDFEFKCPHCKQLLEAPDDMRGRAIECPACNGSVRLPKIRPCSLSSSDSQSKEIKEFHMERNTTKKQRVGIVVSAVWLFLWLIIVPSGFYADFLHAGYVKDSREAAARDALASKRDSYDAAYNQASNAVIAADAVIAARAAYNQATNTKAAYDQAAAVINHAIAVINQANAAQAAALAARAAATPHDGSYRLSDEEWRILGIGEQVPAPVEQPLSAADYEIFTSDVIAARAAYDQASAAYDQAIAVINHAIAAYNQANAAYNQASNAVIAADAEYKDSIGVAVVDHAFVSAMLCLFIGIIPVGICWGIWWIRRAT